MTTYARLLFDARLIRIAMLLIVLALLAKALAVDPTAASPPSPSTGQAFPQEPAPPRLADALTAQAQAFDLSQVALLDSPWKRAQDLDRQSLLQTDLDRLLYPFRREAHLPSPVTGSDSLSWEHTGQALGHYLSASALLLRATGDPEIARRANGLVAALAACQEALGDGYIGGMPEQSVLLLEKRISDRRYAAMVPWYCLHKVYAGLYDMYVLGGNRQALAVLERAVAWISGNVGALDDRQMQAMLETEHGGMVEVLANLAAQTGKASYLDLARRFIDHAMTDPFAQGRDPLDNHHANSQFPKFIGVQRLHELTGDATLGLIALRFWTSVAHERSYVTGGNSLWEGFTPKAVLSHFLTQNTCESCNVYNMLKLTRHLFCEHADASYADFYERALLNHVLSTRHPQTGGQLYFQQLQSGRSKADITEKGNWMLCNQSDTCCYGTGLESAAGFASSIYFHDGLDGIFVNLFIPSILTWEGRGVVLRQETRFPQEGRSLLTISAAEAVLMTVRIRRPWWCLAGFVVRVNGQAQACAAAGSFTAMRRTWQDGDTIEVDMPMSFRTEAFADDARRVALMYGPLVMAAVTDAGNHFSAIRDLGGDLCASLTSIPGRTLCFSAPAALFRTSPLGPASSPLEVRPLLSLIAEPYAVYWRLRTDEELAAAALPYRREAERQAAIEAHTVDAVWTCDSERYPATVRARLAGQPGALPRSALELSESSHGASASHSELYRVDDDARLDDDDLAWCLRRIGAGGSISYRMHVLPEQDQVLTVRLYCRGRQEPSPFEILVAGRVLGTVDAATLPRDRFSDLSFALPATLLAGSTSAEICIRSAKSVPGFAECRITLLR